MHQTQQFTSFEKIPVTIMNKAEEACKLTHSYQATTKYGCGFGCGNRIHPLKNIPGTGALTQGRRAKF